MSAVGTASVSPDNPLRNESPLPFALPPFGDITPEHCREALLAGMAEQRAEVDAIVGSDEPPTFDNTVVALERSGRLLSRAEAVFGNLASSVSTPRMREIEREIAPLEAAHADALRLDPALFARIDAVHEARHDSGLDDEAVRLVERYHLDFVLAGAQLDDAGRARLTELNQELSTLSTTFGQNLQLASEAAAVRVADAAELDGLDAEEIAGAAAAAADRGVDGYLIALLLPTGQPVLAKLRNRDLRRRVFEASIARASAGEHDNRPVAARIARLRAERARLLGFDTHADLVAGRLHRAHHRGRRRDAGVDGPGVGGERRGRGGGARRGRRPGRRRGRALGLGVLQRAGAGRAVRRRHDGAAAVLRARPGPGRRRLPRRGAALRLPLRRRGPIWTATTPTSGCGRSATPTGPRSACTSATSSPGRASGAGPG